MNIIKIFSSLLVILLTLPATLIFLYFSIAKAISEKIIEKMSKNG